MTTISEKRANETEDVYYKANVVLVDIEGTTTSIDFVKNTLFPYVRKNLEVYLKSKWNDDEFKEDLKLLQQQSKQDEADGTEGLVKIPEGFSEDICEDVKKNVLWQMDLDRKTKALKQLQGHIWRDAYKNGEVKAHVYPDVAPALKSWKQSGKDIYVYSSGSVEAQKLLFGHTLDGDLLELFSGYFDTTVGPKVEESSYANIVNSMKRKSEEVIFFTDVPKEARAAKSAGLQAVIVVRDGNLPITDDDKLEFPVIKSFDDIVFETSVKRRKKSEEEPLEQGKTNSAVVDVSSVQDVEMKEESTTVNTETSKATEGVSSTAMVEAEDEQPDSMKQARVKSCVTNEEAKQTSCKDKDAMNSDLASTKQTGGKLVADQGSAEVKEQNVTNTKTLAVNGAEKLDVGSDNTQMESNGLKCPKDNLPKSVANNIDAPIKTTSDASTNSKDAKLNENKNTCSSSEKCHDVAADNLPVTGNVDIVVPDSKTDTKLTDNDKSEINDKTEKCKQDSKVSEDSSLPCGKVSTKPVSSDATDSKVKVESLTDKTESTSPDAAEIASKTECTHNEKTENICKKTESTTTDKSESAPICKTESLKPIDAESKKTESEANKTEPMETDDLTSGDLKNKDEPVQKDKMEVAKGVVPVNEVETDISLTKDEDKSKAAVSSSKNEASAASKTETADDSKPEAAAEATPDGSKTAAEVTPDGGQVEAAAEATPDGGKVEAAAEATPDVDKIEAAAEATPDVGKAEVAAEATPDGSKVEAAVEATPDGGKVEAAAEATPDGGKVEAVMEISPDDCKTEAAEEATLDGGKAEAAMEVSPDDKAVPKATSDDVKTKDAPDSGNAGTAEEVTLTGGKIEAANSMDDANVSKVTSDVKTDSVASVAEVKANDETDVPMEDAEPMVTDDPEQMPTDKAKLVAKEECEPMVTDDSEPMSTDEAKPITEGAKHSLTDDAEPMVTEGSEPMVTKENENVNSTVNDGEKPETEQPEKDTKANEKSNECTKNVPSDSTHAVDSTSCNSMNKDVAVNDTNDSAGTGKSDIAATVKDGETLETKTELSNTEKVISKAEDQNVVDNVKEVKNEVKGGENSVNSCIENGESTDKTDNTSEKLKIAAEGTDKVAENAVST